MADPLALELEAIKRGISTAELMRQQALAPRRIGSLTQGFAQLAQAFAARRAGEQADARLAAFQETQKSRRDRVSKLLAEGKIDEAVAESGDVELQEKFAFQKQHQKRQDKRFNEQTRQFEERQKQQQQQFEERMKLSREQFDAQAEKTRTTAERANVDNVSLRSYTDKLSSATAFNELAGKSINDIETNPDDYTFTARTVEGGASKIAAEASAIGASIKKYFTEDGQADSADSYLNQAAATASKTSSNPAVAASRIKLLVYQLAAAHGQSGRALSDQDVKRFTDIVTGSWGSPKDLAANLDNLIESNNSTLKKEAEQNGGGVFNDRFEIYTKQNKDVHRYSGIFDGKESTSTGSRGGPAKATVSNW